MSDFIATESIAWGPGPKTVGKVLYGHDEQMVVRFYRKAVKSTDHDIAAGKPPFVSVDYVMIKEPGDRLHIIDKPVEEEHKWRWPRLYELFQKQQEQIPDGTPIEVLFRSEPDIVARLKQAGIHVIQQVAEMSEHTMHSLGMGARTWQQRGAKFLETAGNHAQVAALESEMQTLRDQLRAIQEERLAEVQEAKRRARREPSEVAA